MESCEDFGRIVFAMVDAQLIGASEEDSIDDFSGVYAFDDAFPLPPGTTVRIDKVCE